MNENTRTPHNNYGTSTPGYAGLDMLAPIEADGPTAHHLQAHAHICCAVQQQLLPTTTSKNSKPRQKALTATTWRLMAEYITHGKYRQ